MNDLARESFGNANQSVNLMDEPFPFEFQLLTDLDVPLVVGDAGVSIKCAIRHAHDSELQVSGAPGAFNFGLRLINLGKKIVEFETRAYREVTTLPRMVWFNITFKIPRDIIECDVPYLLKLDFVKEHEFWFARKRGADYSYDISFSEKSVSPDMESRLSQLEFELKTVRHEFKVYSESADENIHALSPVISEIKAFRAQLPRLTNAISSANAAAAIVGNVRSSLDAENGRIAKTLEDFRQETKALWESLNVLSAQVPPIGARRDVGAN